MAENDDIRELLTAIAYKNDQAAYKQLFLLLHSRLKQFSYAILKSKEEAEELVSDPFIRIWEKRTTLTSIESPLLYFFVSAKNLAINRLNRQKKQPLPPEDWLVQLNSIYFDPEQLMITEEMVRQIRKAVNDLPSRCRLIFKLVKEDGLKYREVSQLLNISIKTVQAQMPIALTRLGKSMHLEIKSPTAATLSLKK